MRKIPTVAIVDDDEAVREALSDLLTVSGFKCHGYPGAAAFLAEYVEVGFDCLVTDIRMPGMSGIDLLERLHADGSQLPVVVLTSVLDEPSRARALALGARSWLMKPATDHVLLDEISLAIAGRRR